MPAFHPSPCQFSDFHLFISRILPVLSLTGLCKVVPPACYVPNAAHYADIPASFTIHTPIVQKVLTGRPGEHQVLAEAQPSCSVRSFAARAARVEEQRSAREKQWAAANDYEQLEAAYWKNIGFSSPVYGADSPGSLFDAGAAWNMRRLHSLLDIVGDSIGGVTAPMLYFGEWKATFGWHVEDMNLFSINFLHFGHPKQWYAVPPAYAERFESTVSSLMPALSRSCPSFLRHKQILVKPSRLQSHGVRVLSAVQHEGEFMLTYPLAYHQGYNLGFNCAESVNFATEGWLEWGDRADVCRCRKSSVKIDVDDMRRKIDAVKQARLTMRQQAAAEEERKEQEAEADGDDAPLSMDLIASHPELLAALRAAAEPAMGPAVSGQRSMTGLAVSQTAVTSSPLSSSSTESTAPSSSVSVSVAVPFDAMTASSETASASEAVEADSALAAALQSDDEDESLEYAEEFIPENVNVALVCGWANCDSGHFRNTKALMKHYQTAHSTAASASSSSGKKSRRRRGGQHGDGDEDDYSLRRGNSSSSKRRRQRRVSHQEEKEEEQAEQETERSKDEDGGEAELSMRQLLKDVATKLRLSDRWTREELEQTPAAAAAAATSAAASVPPWQEEEKTQEAMSDSPAVAAVDAERLAEAILSHRRHKKGQLLFEVRWSDAVTTWEPLAHGQSTAHWWHSCRICLSPLPGCRLLMLPVLFVC